MGGKKKVVLMQIEFVKMQRECQLKFSTSLFEWLEYQKIDLPIQEDNNFAIRSFLSLENDSLIQKRLL